jgi:hypothetical protein
LIKRPEGENTQSYFLGIKALLNIFNVDSHFFGIESIVNAALPGERQVTHFQDFGGRRRNRLWASH